MPVAHAALPSVVHLEHVEQKAAHIVEHVAYSTFVDAPVERVPRAPHPGTAGGAPPQTLTQQLRVPGEDVVLLAPGDQPLAGVGRPTDEVTAPHLDPPSDVERSDEEDLTADSD